MAQKVPSISHTISTRVCRFNCLSMRIQTMQLAPRRRGRAARVTMSIAKRTASESGLSPRASCSLCSPETSLAETCLRIVGLPQSGRSCSEVESELHVARGEIERNKVTGGVAVMAVVEYHPVRRRRF